MHLHRRTLPLVVALLAVGCPKEEKKSDDTKSASTESKPEGKKAKSDEDEGEKKPKKKKHDGDDEPKADDDKSAKPKPSGEHALAGVDVPAWSKPGKPGKCAMSKSETERLETLKKGDDGGAGFDDGKGDVDAIVDPLKKSCANAGAMVSQALNAGGYTRYAKKEYGKADGWFARALAADPTNTFARYNLACNLALEGNAKEALWNLEQLVPAAKAGDPRAVHYLTKAKSDSDLASVRKDARFAAATAHGEPVAGLMPCPHDKEVHADEGKICLQICASYGGQAGCPPGQACVGASTFGAGLVPYCASILKCKDDEEELHPFTKDNVPDKKPACFQRCDSDANCSKGKKCTGMAAEPNPYGWLTIPVCE